MTFSPSDVAARLGISVPLARRYFSAARAKAEIAAGRRRRDEVPPYLVPYLDLGPLSVPTSKASHGQVSGRYRDAMKKAMAMLPTPRATEWRNPKGKTGNRTEEARNRAGWTLSEIALLSTPTANRRDGLQSHGVNVVEGSLNPQFVEYLMNFPTDWTKLE